MSQDNHLRVSSHDIFFKSHVKSLGVYINAILFVAKHTDHIGRSAYREIRRISCLLSPDKESHFSADVFLRFQ